ncbi:MFS transporter [Acidovorax sp. RAC01]|uniref:MFS transporter n=1 Tax=Acidovorax sp. RAC01 TaxID=1842533 RepID=UPI00085649DE|nr:MFS transporter [Acidovorax sp. RAC01]AOG23941.1 major Facilitator Superfamily protein [Acidovorax sp. RAC01]
MQSTTTMLRLISLAAFSSMASMRVCDPMLVALAAEFRITTGDAAAVVAAFAVAYGVLQLVYGPLGDRLGKLQVIIGATAACAVFNAVTAMAPGFTVLVVARAAMGAAAAGIIPLSMAWIGDQVPYAQRQETLARLMGATVTGMMAGQWFGGFATETLGWRAAFAVLSVLFAVAAVLLWRHVRAASTTPEAIAQAAAEGVAGRPPFSLAGYVAGTVALLRMPRVRWVLAVVAIEGALAFGTLAFVPARMVDGFGLSASAAGGAMVLYGVGGLLYSVFARRWLAWLGERGLALAGGTMIAAGLLLLAWAPVVAWAVVGCFLAGLGFYMLHNTLQVQATQMAPEARGTAVTLFACLLFLGQSTGVLIVAFSVDRGWLPPVFTAAAVGVFVLGLLVSRRVQARGAVAGA